VLEFLDSALEDCKIRHAGFSFHDKLELFKEIVNSYNWDFSLIQYNYMDQDFQAGKEGLHYLAERNMGVITMEPSAAVASPTTYPRIFWPYGIKPKLKGASLNGPCVSFGTRRKSTWF